MSWQEVASDAVHAAYALGIAWIAYRQRAIERGLEATLRALRRRRDT